MNKLKTSESELVKKYQSLKSDDLAKKILMAPDQFTAAVMMKIEGLFFGRGDFQKIIDLLSNFKNKEFKCIAEKL